MLNHGEFQELVEDLHSKELSMRVATLKTLQKYPSGDERVLQHIEALLDDKTLCVLMLPYRFGEIRWLAAQALAAERASLGNEEPVRLQRSLSLDSKPNRFDLATYRLFNRILCGFI